MIRGIYTSALGMTTQMNKMDVVSNNIANANTVGYKKDVSATRSFTDEMMKRLDDPGDLVHDIENGKVSQGVFIDDIYTDFSNGSYIQTASPLDVAIMGEGFFSFMVKNDNNEVTEKYGRNGSFTVGGDGKLLTKEGHKVMGEKGEITLPKGEINIDEKGNISVDSVFIDKLKMVNVTDTHSLRKYGDNLYDITPETEMADFIGKIENGNIETSNINSVKEMVDMITVSRAYEANQRMVAIQDSTLGKAVNEIGRK